VRDAETAGLAGLFPIIILFFTSSALVPVTTMPGWLQAFAKVNPITVITDALRALCLGGPTVRPAAEAVTWLIGLLAVTVPATIARYRHTASTQPRRAGDEQAALAPLLAGSPRYPPPGRAPAAAVQRVDDRRERRRCGGPRLGDLALL